MAIKKSSSSGIPSGNTAGRPANPGPGQLYSNGEAQRLELYTTGGSWENIVQEVPGVSSISGNYSEQTNSGVITIYGTNFVNGAYATAIGSNGVQVNATSTTYNSLVQLTAVFTGLSSQYEPYDIKVTNPSNLFGIFPDSLYVNNTPIWQTSAGSLGTFAEQVSMSVSATASDSDSTISYTLVSGSTLPSGVSLNSASGLISGTLPNVESNTTYTFTINASDGVNTIPRTFSFISNAAPTWVTALGSLGTYSDGSSISISLSATDPTDSVTYSLLSGSLPSGITLSSSGVVSGTAPETSGTSTFTVIASDGLNSVSRQFSITINAPAVNIDYLVVAGGGGGGLGNGGYREGGGGGGAGGVASGTLTRTLGATYLITAGSAGLGRTSAQGLGQGGDGGNSTFGAFTVSGGGGGGLQDGNGRPGGSGGGAGCQGSSGGSGITGQGFPGGAGYIGSHASAGGGGGHGSAGQNGLSGQSTGGAGGSGLTTAITGTSFVYAAGGGGGGHTNGGAAGGVGAGRGGGQGSGQPPTAASANTGSGGGGGNDLGGTNNGKDGGSGVVVIAYPNTKPALANIPGTLTYDQPTRSGYRVYRFTAGSGTITI